MDREKFVQSLFKLIKLNQVEDDVRICLTQPEIKAPNVFIRSLIEFIQENHAVDEVVYGLLQEVAKRTKLSFELHWPDGFRSNYYEMRVLAPDAFYWNGWLISLNTTSKATHYDETLRLAQKVYLEGQGCQLLPKSFYETSVLPNLAKLNGFLHQVRGYEFFGSDWCLAEEGCCCVSFDKETFFLTSQTMHCLCGRPAIKL